MKNRIYDKRHKAKVKIAKNKLYDIIGKICYICDRKDKLKCHRKDYKKHKDIASLSSLISLKRENLNDYVRLCFQCHFGVHWLKNNFGLSWEQIQKLCSNRR